MHELHGLILIDKPEGLSSHEVVQRARKRLRTRKIGHGGTLDPNASGMLPLLVGDATRFARFFLEGQKAYKATVQLGSQTDTDDAEGTLIAQGIVSEDILSRLPAVMAALTGTHHQVPPSYCARHHEGKRYYDWARQGDPRTPPAHLITVSSLHYSPPSSDHRFDFSCVVSSGTYIRAMARDIGTALGCFAHLHALRRLWSEPYQGHAMISYEALSPDVTAHPAWHPLESLMPHLPCHHLSTPEAIALAQGKRLSVAITAPESSLVRVFYKSILLGVCSYHETDLSVLRLRPNPMDCVLAQD